MPYATYDSGTPVVNYINNGANCSGTSRLSNQPTCISSLSQTQAAALDPKGTGYNLPLLNYINGRYPKPNDLTTGDGVNTGGFRFTSPTPDFDTTYIGRIDYNLTSAHKIFGRFTINREDAVYALPEFKGDPNSTGYQDRSYAYVVGDTWSIGKNKVNQFYYGDNISKLNFPASDFFTSPNVYSFTGLSAPYGSANSQKRRVPIPVVRDDFSWQIKSHDISFGGLFKFIKTNSNSIYDYNFVGVGLTGNALDTGLLTSERPATINGSSTAENDYDNLYATALGVIGNISTNFDYNKSGIALPGGSGGPRAYRYFETEAYFSDTWKVNKQLTLTYGLRYQLYSVPYEAHGDESISNIIGLTQRQSTFNAYMENRLAQSAAGVSGNTALPFYEETLGGKANNAPSSYAPSYKDLAPRFAAAYNPTWSRKTVFNIGAGLVYDRTVINAINFLQDQLSFLFYNNNTNQLGDLSSAPRLNACTTGPTCTGPTGLSYVSTNNPVPQAIGPGYIPYVSGGTPYGLQAGQEGFIISPNLRDPYNIDMNAGVQRELPFHMVLKVNYDGRLGRRLLADADASQVLNFADSQSSQTLSQAFGSITTQTRSGVNPGTTALAPQPWIEDIVGNYLGSTFGFPNYTTLAAYYSGVLAPRGDLGDMIQSLAYYGILPPNVGIPAQFGTQAYLTNMGSSNYNALLVTLNKNLSQGLKFDFNYTYSHSIDNNSQTANNNALYNVTGIICDVTQPRACRGNSDFDVRQEISSDFTYELPVGKGKMFAGDDSRLLDEFIGGWALSGLPAYRTGSLVQSAVVCLPSLLRC